MKNIIWESDYDVKDFEDSFDEFEIPEEDRDEYAYRMHYEYLEDERMNLDIELEENIVILADLGLWFGRRDGYKEIGNNISEALYTDDDYITWYVDRYDMRGDGAHHDGNNHYLYRVWKNGITDTQKENFLSKWASGKATRKDITRYTKSLRPYIANVYGW